MKTFRTCLKSSKQVWRKAKMFSPWFDEAKQSLADIAEFAHKIDKD